MGKIIWCIEFKDNNPCNIIKNHGDSVIGAYSDDDSRGAIDNGTIEEYNAVVCQLFKRTFKPQYKNETYTASYIDSERHIVQRNIGCNKIAHINEDEH